MIKTLFFLAVAFLLLAALFYSVELLFPSRKDKPIWRKDSRLDLAYWFFTAAVTKTIGKLVVLAGIVACTMALGRELSPAVANGFSPVADQPALLCALEILIFGDLIAYLMHRAFHRRRLWKFHAVHHSSTQVDWLSSVRLHPVNEFATRLVQVLPFVLMGFPLTLLAAYVPFLKLYAILLHANVDWSFGPLKYVIATPAFHRWHHSCEKAAINKNFAGLFPVWDLIFGTFYMPEGEVPREFGAVGAKVPGTLLGQLVYPFK